MGYPVAIQLQAWLAAEIVFPPKVWTTHGRTEARRLDASCAPREEMVLFPTLSPSDLFLVCLFEYTAVPFGAFKEERKPLAHIFFLFISFRVAGRRRQGFDSRHGINRTLARRIGQSELDCGRMRPTAASPSLDEKTCHWYWIFICGD